MKRMHLKIGYILISLFIAGTISANEVDHTINKQVKQIEKNQTSQKKIDVYDTERQELLTEYRQALQETKELKVYNEQMRDMLASQKEEMQSIVTKVKEMDATQRGIVPLMVDMLATLKYFVDLDTPFLPSERSQRIKDLEEMMSRADVSTSEKYRRILEAYQVEMEYGRTLEAYKDSIVINGKKSMVQLLRMGRVGLYYLSLDGKEAGIWNKERKTWTKLSRGHAYQITQAVKVAEKHMAPTLLELPIHKAEVL